MNRALVIPALGCALTFTGLFALLHRAPASGEAPPQATPQAPAEAATTDVRATLESLAAEFVRPWQAYRQAPSSRFARTIVTREVPSITAAVEIAAGDAALPGTPVLASIHVTIIGVSTTSTPCIIDAETKEVRLFAAGRWQRPEDWMKTAPNPRTFKAPAGQSSPQQPADQPADAAP